MTDKIIEELFLNNWHGEEVTKSLNNMKKQLNKNLNDQKNGYSSGSTAFYIMVEGGFLKPSGKGKTGTLTELGQTFIDDYKKRGLDDR